MVSIKIPSEPLVRGGTVTFTAKADADETLTWTAGPPGAATIDANTGDLTVEDRPAAPYVTVEVHAKKPDGKPSGTDSAKVGITLEWPEDWPYLSDGGLPWFSDSASKGAIPWADGGNEAKADRLRIILWDLVDQLPQGVRDALGPVPFVRVTWVNDNRGGIAIALPSGGAVAVNDTCFTALTADSPKIEPADENIVGLLAHELGHMVMSGLLGPAVWFKALASLTVAILEVVGAAFGEYEAIMHGVLVVPPFPKIAEIVLRTSIWGWGDEMSDYASKGGWQVPSLVGFDVPLLNLLFPWLAAEAPNGLTAWASLNPKQPGLPIPLTNTTFDAATVLALNPADPNYATNLGKAGVPTPYAATNPHEDFAETFARLLLGAKYHGTNAVEPSKDRRDYFIRKGLLVDHPGTPTFIQGAHVAGTLVPDSAAPPSWRLAARAKPKPKQARHVMAAAEFDPDKFDEALLKWYDGPERRIEDARAILAKLPRPPAEAAPLPFLAAAEMHGDGLARYRGVEHPLDPGALLTSDDQRVWLATRVDEQRRVTTVIGDPGGETLPAGGNLPQTDRDALVLHWQPDATPRDWAAGGQPLSPNYADVDAALAQLVPLWGRTDTDNFFVAALHASGLADADKDTGLPKEPCGRDVLAYCETHGDGLVRYEPGVGVAVGDFALLYGGTAWGVVTRVTPDGTPVDVLVGDPTHIPGLVGEEPDAVKLRHGLDLTALPVYAADSDDVLRRRALNATHPLDVDHIWRPAATTRRYVTEEAPVSDAFENLNLALNHLVSHVGLDYLERQGETTQTGNTDMVWASVGLLLERGATADARKRLRGFHGSEREVRDSRFFYGTLSSGGPVQPGDVIGWRTKGGTAEGVVLTVDGGEATRVFTQGKQFVVRDDRVPAESVVWAWTPSATPRELVDDPAIAAFYGDPSALERLVNLRSTAAIPYEDHNYGGESYTCFYTKPDGFVRLLSLNAPDDVRKALWADTDTEFAGLRAALDHFGAGVQPYQPGTAVPHGAWLLGKSTIRVVLLTTPKGEPALVLTPGVEALADPGIWIDEPPAHGLTEMWVPSVKPRK
ncbi:MAG: hypothetical protein QOC82_2994 [Frankiaceae bacterium]|jgi:hypothetical protein|nr:hypothetical protein [Frankiaceae bacterium]